MNSNSEITIQCIFNVYEAVKTGIIIFDARYTCNITCSIYGSCKDVTIYFFGTCNIDCESSDNCL